MLVFPPQNSVGYSEVPGVGSVLDLPLRDGDLSMVVVMPPRASSGLQGLLRAIQSSGGELRDLVLFPESLDRRTVS